MKNYSIAEARDRLPRLVHEAEAGKPIGLTRRGRAVAVVVSAKDYRQLVAPVTTPWAAIEKFRSQSDLETLGIDPDRVFETQRARTTGRKVKL